HFRERAGFVWAPWCGDAGCEARVKEETGGVTARAIDSSAQVEGTCLCCDRPATERVVFARSY
ncbi:MAG: proline--tRNA ligase, partial [Candidatus Dormibacteraceae bacterium]